MKSFAFFALVTLAASCGPDPNAQLPGFVQGAGGSVGTGGSVGGGGGKVGSGGAAGSTVNTDAAAGGAATGGVAAGGSTGAGFGGAAGGGAGGDGSDASTAPKDAAISTSDVSPTCITQVVSNGYSCGASTSCADCKDNNGNSREAGCKAAIDCIAEKGASCDNNCQANCRNLAGDIFGLACVQSLQNAACGGAGCGSTSPDGGG